MKYCLGIPVAGNVNGAVYHSHLDFVAAIIAGGAKQVIIPQAVDIFPHDRAREHLIGFGLEHEADYFVWLDSDMQPEFAMFDELNKVITKADPDVAMVTAHAYRRGYPYTSMWFKMAGDQPMTVMGDRYAPQVEIDTCGLACCIVNMKFVREKLKAPYFFMGWEYNEAVKSHVFIWEDAYFCRSIRQAGGKIIAVPSARCGHCGLAQVIDDSNAEYLRQTYMKGM